jgi:hypothetical protein
MPGRIRPVVVVSDPSQHEHVGHADVHYLVVPPRLERAEVLNRAYRLIRTRSRDYGEDPVRTAVGIIDAGALPDEDLVKAVGRAFHDPRVGAVQARVEIVGGGLGAAEQYEQGVLADSANLVRSRRGHARLGVTGAFVRLSALSRLGPRPWRPEASTDGDLGLRLRRQGVLIHHRPDARVYVRGADQKNLLRRYIRAVEGRLRAWPASGVRRLRWERLSWATSLIGWVLPGVAALWALTAFSAAAARLLAAPESGTSDSPWLALAWTALGLDTPSWEALLTAAGPWLGAAVVPVVVWWVARRDLTVGRLVRGALTWPLLLLGRPVAFGLALGRTMLGLRTTDPVGEPAGPVSATNQDFSPTNEDAVDAKPVFVDATGRRRRRVWTVAYATSTAALAYVVAFGFALAGGEISPHAGVGDRPRIAYPMPTPSPTPEPEAEVEPMVMVGGGVGWVDTPVSVEVTAPASGSDEPSVSDEPSPSDGSTTPGEPTQTGEPSDPADPTDPPVSPPSETETSTASGAAVDPPTGDNDDSDFDV